MASKAQRDGGEIGGEEHFVSVREGLQDGDELERKATESTFHSQFTYGGSTGR